MLLAFFEVLYTYLLILLLTDHNNYDLTLMINTYPIFFSFVCCIIPSILRASIPMSCLSEGKQQSP